LVGSIEPIKRILVGTFEVMTTQQEQLKKYLADKKVEEMLTALLEQICILRPDNVPRFIVSHFEKPEQTNDQLVFNSESDDEVDDPEYKKAFHSFQLENFGGNQRDSTTEDGRRGSAERRESQEVLLKEKERLQEQQITTEIDTESSENIRRRYSISTLRRRAFSSESINATEIQSFVPPKIPKTTDERNRLERALKGNPLFSHFEREDCAIMYDAMFSISFSKGDIIIRQGDKGDNFYIIDGGTCEVFVRFDQEHEELAKVCRVGDSFGELALMYGTPRAATVKAATDCKLWAIDRMSYRKIIMGRTMMKRDLYEGFLKRVPILENLDSYERLTVADALVPQNFVEDDLIIQQGDIGEFFFIILEGEAQVWKTLDGKRLDLVVLKKGDYFGELALLFNQPRAANVTCLSPLKTVTLDVTSFKLLLGPVDAILKRNTENYEYFMKKNIKK
jgi:cAMP-dependent protein kinase regulator